MAVTFRSNFKKVIADTDRYLAFPAAASSPEGIVATWSDMRDHYAQADRVARYTYSKDNGRTWATPYAPSEVGWGAVQLASLNGRFASLEQAPSPRRGRIRIAEAFPTQAASWGAANLVDFSGGQEVEPAAWAFPSGLYWHDDGTRDGVLLVLGYGSRGVLLVASRDLGKTWEKRESPFPEPFGDGTGPSEALIVEAGNGDLIMTCRADRESGSVVFTSRSTDDGMTWSAPRYAWNASGQPLATRLETGLLVATTREREQDAYPGNWGLALSEDDGKTWTRHRLNDEWMMYGGLVPLGGARVLIVGASQTRGVSTDSNIWAQELELTSDRLPKPPEPDPLPYVHRQMSMRLVAMNGDEEVEVLQDWGQLQLVTPLNDTPSLRFTMPGLTRDEDGNTILAKSGRFLLSQELDVSVQFSFDGSAWREPPSCRFIVVQDDSDPAEDNRVQIDCIGVDFDLAGMIPTDSYLFANEEGKWKFKKGTTAGNILGAYFDKAQKVGAGTSLDRDFWFTRDSDAKAWDKTIGMSFAPTITLRQVADSLTDQGMIDWRFEGNIFRAFNADTYMRKPRDVELVFGRDIQSLPQQRSVQDVAHTAVVWGEENLREVVEVPSTRKRGRRIVVNSQGGVSDRETARSLANAMLAERAGTREELTRDYDFLNATTLPFRDYEVGDMIFAPGLEGVLEELRVFAVTIISPDGHDLKGAVTLGDRFLEASIRQTRRIQGIVGGSTISGGSNAVPVTTPPKQKEKPKAPSGMIFSSEPYTVSKYRTRAKVDILWSQELKDVNGDPLKEQISRTAFQGRRVGSSTWESWGSNWEDIATRADLDPGVTYEARACCVAGTVWSTWSAPAQFIAATDHEPPQLPSAPILSSSMGTVTAQWDGLDYQGTDKWPADFDAVIVLVDGDDRGWLRGAGDSVQLDGYSSGDEVYIEFVSVDTSGNRSAPTGAAVTVKSVLDDAGLTDKLAELNDELQRIAAAAGDDEALQATLEELRTLSEAMEASEQRMNEAAAQLDELQADLAELGSHEGRIASAEAALVDLATLHDDLDSANESLEAAKADIQDALSRVQESEGDISSLRTELGSLSGAQGSLSSKLAELEGALGGIRSDVEAAKALRDMIVSTSAPVAGAKGYEPGATWMHVDASNEVIGQWRNTGSNTSATWTKVELSGSVIAANTIKGSHVEAGSIATGHLAADAVTADKIAANAVTAEQIAADAVTANAIKAGEVTTLALAADAVTADKVAANAVTASAIKAGEITGSHIAADTLTSREIATNAITADELAANAVKANHIEAGAVVAGKLGADAVTANNIAAGAVQAEQLDASAVTAEKIASGAVTADAIAARAIGAEHLTIRPGNLLVDPLMARKEVWGNSSYWQANGGRTGGGSLSIPEGSTQRGTYTTNTVLAFNAPIETGKTYRLSAWFNPSQPVTERNSVAIYQRWKDENGNFIGRINSTANNPEGSFAADTWHQLSGKTAPAPEGATRLIFGLYVQARFPGAVVFSDPAATEMADASLIVDGSILAQHLSAGSVTANAIASGAVTTEHMTAGSIDADRINAGSYRGQVISGATIISSETDSPTAENVTISNRTIAVNRDDGEGGLVPTLTFGGSTSDELALRPAGNSTPNVLISGDSGDAGFAGEVSVGNLTVGGDTLADILRPLPRGVVGMTWGSGASLPDIGQSEYGLVRFSGVENGRRYRLTAEVKFQGTANDTIEFLLRESNDPNGATVSSSRLALWRHSVPVGGIGAATLQRTFNVTSDGDSYSLLLSMRNWSANTRPVGLWSDGGSTQSQTYFVLEDLGSIRGGAGVTWTSAGGTAFGGQTAPPPPAATKRTYNKTYAASAVRSWRGSATVTSELGHGTYGGYKRVSQILFPASVKTDLAGATNIKARVKLRNTHTWSGASMTAYVGSGTQTSLASSAASSASNQTHSWKRGESKFVSVPWTASSQSVWLGVGAPAGNQYYGKFSSTLSDFVLEVTYDK